MKLNRKMRRWLKKIGGIAIGALIVANVVMGSILYTKVIVGNQKESPQIVEIKQEYDLTKINDILAKNNLEVLEIDFESTFSKTVVDQPKFDIFKGAFKEFRNKFKSKTLNLSAEFTALYKYDLSKLTATRIGDVTVIELNKDDIDINIQYKNVVANADYTFLADYFTPQQIADIEAEMLESAKKDITMRDTYKDEALKNTKLDILNLFEKCGIETNDILIRW